MPRIVSWKKLRFRFDWTLTGAIVAVMGLGLLNLWSAVRERQFQLFGQQLSWIALGALVFLAVASFDYRIIARLGYIFYGGGVALLLAVLTAGKVVGGSRRWFDLGPLHLQPSEVMKVLTVIAVAKYINDSPAPEGRECWTLQLLADRVVALGLADSCSYETVRRVLKKTHSSRGSNGSGAFRT